MSKNFRLTNWSKVGVTVLVAAMSACSSSNADPTGYLAPALGGATANGTGGSVAATGGRLNSVGGSATGGSVVSSIGGSATGGSAVSSVGGSAMGGQATGGQATGGQTNVGGSSKGGQATGGQANVGGSSKGGQATGGQANTGGANTGGQATGGVAATGGASSTCPTLASQTCTVGESNCFSFFVASRARMFALAQKFNGSTKGWGGDLRYGAADGPTGADKICTEIAKQSMPTNCRTWKAFLSTSKVNAITRVGTGPWYDRLNRKIATNLTELAATRPGGITNATILNNLPNEDGTPHHNEEPNCTDLNKCGDNHDVLTGSDSDGKLCTSSSCTDFGIGGAVTVTDYTCKDWTLSTSTAGIAPRVGHTWPTGGGLGGGGVDDWISILTEAGCAPSYNLVQDGGPTADGMGGVGDGGGYGAIYCLASQ